jgi:hypothetical protein
MIICFQGYIIHLMHAIITTPVRPASFFLFIPFSGVETNDCVSEKRRLPHDASAPSLLVEALAYHDGIGQPLQVKGLYCSTPYGCQDCQRGSSCS